MDAMALRAQILAADDLGRKSVPVPEWGCTVWVRQITAGERDDLELSVMAVEGDTKERLKHFRSRLVCMTVVDEGGGQIFLPEDIEAIAGKSGAVVDRLAEAAQELNLMDKAAVDALVKNSETAPDADT